MHLRTTLIPGPEVEGSRPRARAVFANNDRNARMRDFSRAPGGSSKYTAVQLQGRTIRNGLFRLAHHRRHTGQGIGHGWSWLETAADVAAAIYGANLSVSQVEGLCIRIGLPPQDPGIYERLAARASDARRSAGAENLGLLDPEVVGKRVELTAEEREGLCIKRIGSIDETPSERAKRKGRERKGAVRAASGATPRSKSKAATKPWEAMGVSKSTYYYRGWHRGRTESSA